MFRNVELLIDHCMTVHCGVNDNKPSTTPAATSTSQNNGRVASKQETAKTTTSSENMTEKCPKCFKRYNAIELPVHM